MTPQFLVQQMLAHPLSRDLYPIAMGFYPRASAHRMRRTEHDSFLLIYCQDGRGSLTVEERTWQVLPGDLILLPRGTPHEYRANQRAPWSIYWVHYDGELSAEYTEAFAQPSPVVNIGQHPRLIADFEGLCALRNVGFAQPAFIHGACQLKQLLTYLATLMVQHQPQGGQRIDLDRVQELMHLRLDASLDLAALAAEANMSKYHFARRFKQLTGHSPIQHFIHLKMQHACHLLDASGRAIKQVSAEVGYDDPYYFSRLFKQVIGMSPRDYRRSRQA